MATARLAAKPPAAPAQVFFGLTLASPAARAVNGVALPVFGVS